VGLGEMILQKSGVPHPSLNLKTSKTFRSLPSAPTTHAVTTINTGHFSFSFL